MDPQPLLRQLGPRFPRLGRAVLAAGLLLRHLRPRSDGAPLGHGALAAATHLPRTLLRRRLSHLPSQFQLCGDRVQRQESPRVGLCDGKLCSPHDRTQVSLLLTFDAWWIPVCCMYRQFLSKYQRYSGNIPWICRFCHEIQQSANV